MRISDWSSDVCSSDLLVHRLILPERIVRRVRGDLAPEADLIEPALLREGARRTGGEVKIVIVAIARPPFDAVVARGILFEAVGQVLLEIGRASCRERVCQYV